MKMRNLHKETNVCAHQFVTFKGSNKDKEIFLRLINRNISVVHFCLARLCVAEANGGNQLPPPTESTV